MRYEFQNVLRQSAFAVCALLPAIAFGADSPAPREVVNFNDSTAFRLRSNQAKADPITIDGRRSLQITTDATADWPEVVIEPRGAKWDLSGFDAVAMDVRNPQDVAVRVLLAINNPGADARQHCNVASVTVGPNDRTTLVLPFGMWHSELNHPIDVKNIVSVKIFLDRPGRSHRFMVENIRAVPFDRSRMKAVFATPFFRQLQPVFGRGVNLGNALESPARANWGVVLKEEYFELIKAAGFDSVRIPVRWSDYAEDAPPYRIDPKFFQRVDWAVDQAIKWKLTPIVNVHHYDALTNNPDKHRERFLALWRQIAEHYADYPPALALELLNEPMGKLTSDKWNRLAADAIAVVRRSNPTRKIVVGPVGWNSIADLASLRLPEADRNLVVTVHYYSPFQFTHQGASWAGPESRKWLGTKWTGTKQEQEAIIRDLDTAIAWAVQHRRPLYLGEFGAYEKADLESCARWTRFVADEAVKRKMGFGYWEFCSGFGVYDPKRQEWIEPLKKALLGR